MIFVKIGFFSWFFNNNVVNFKIEIDINVMVKKVVFILKVGSDVVVLFVELLNFVELFFECNLYKKVFDVFKK